MGEMTDFFRKYVTEPRYSITDWDEADVLEFRKFLIKKIKAIIELTAGQKADELIEQLVQVTFAEDDTLTMKFDFCMNGTEALSILQMAKMRREKAEEIARQNIACKRKDINCLDHCDVTAACPCTPDCPGYEDCFKF